jgi:hypothetical protein
VVHSKGLTSSLVICFFDEMMLLVGLGLDYAEDVGSDSLCLFEGISEFVAFSVKMNTVDIAKFASGEVAGLGEDECIAIVFAVCSLGDGCLMCLKNSIRSGGLSTN